MKFIIFLGLIVILNVAVSQTAAINVQNESELQIEPRYFEEKIDAIEEHPRHRRQTSNGQASVDVQRQGGRTSVNAQVGKVWETNKGNTRIEVNGNYGRDFGRGGSKPNYGANVGINHRW